MRNLFIGLVITGFMGLGMTSSVSANPVIEEVSIFCDGCKGDKNCDDKCKKGKKSKCCKSEKSKSKKCCASKTASTAKKCSKTAEVKKTSCSKSTASTEKPKKEEAEK